MSKTNDTAARRVLTDSELTDSELDTIAGGLLPNLISTMAQTMAQILSVPPPPPPAWDGWPIGW
jgi:hypothetical protein